MNIDLTKNECKYIVMLMQLDDRSKKPLYQCDSLKMDESAWYDLLEKVNKVQCGRI